MDVPTLHILFSKLHPHPAPRPYSDVMISYEGRTLEMGDNVGESSRMARVREELLAWIANEALGGDREVAEWVLLACIARV